MHELAIATELVRQVVAIANEHRAACVEEIVVECGQMRQIVPEALELSFSVAAEGTVAQGARLCLIEEVIVAVCRQCQHQFTPQVGDFMCPQCGQADARIVAGDQIILKSVVCQTDGEAAGL